LVAGLADLISVPFQNNFNFGGGPDDDVNTLIVTAHIPAVDQRAIALSGSLCLGIVYSADPVQRVVWSINR